MQQGGILIIDDNEINREICAINLEDMRVPLAFAENGRDGLEKAAMIIPDLILLDIMMPVMDGFEMLAKLKCDDVLSEIPVLMLTAKSETDSIVKALELGANDYLKKPFEEEEMVARVKTLLRSRYLEKQLKEDLVTGAAMQNRFLTDARATTSLFAESSLSVEIFNKPFATISGDFYYSYPLPNSGCGIFIGDSCGHGLPAALISMRVIGVLQQIARECPGPSEILARLNDDLYGLLPSEKFVAGSCLAFFGNTCTMSNAAQPYPILLSASGIEEICLDAMPLGMKNSSSYRDRTIELGPDDKLIVFTDGLIEATDWQEVCYGKDRIHECLKKNIGVRTLKELKDILLEDLHLFTKNRPIDDDQTILLFERNM
jgi:sigma-B regulation protein RsbU (phosphoserine phosphatase)